MVLFLPTVDPGLLRPEPQGAISQLAAENQPAVKGGLIIPSAIDRGTSPADQAKPVKIVRPAGAAS